MSTFLSAQLNGSTLTGNTGYANFMFGNSGFVEINGDIKFSS
jgi:hypothetical protein